MRRSGPHNALLAAEQQRLLAALASLDTGAVGRVLEAHATEARRQRIRAVLDARLDSVTVLMDAPHDPHNGAAVVRSCDAFGVQRLHVIERFESFLAARTVSRGSQRWVDVHTYGQTADALAALAASGHELVGTHPEGELLPHDLGAIPRLALVLGNERDGIHPELAAACKRRVRVPMRGFAESLNVSVTAAILLQRATEGRAGDLDEAERSHLYARALVLTLDHAPEVLAAHGIHLPADVVTPLTHGHAEPPPQRRRGHGGPPAAG
jgi:tRNA (guanosine-2'-O-)-methyltransferase